MRNGEGEAAADDSPPTHIRKTSNRLVLTSCPVLCHCPVSWFERASAKLRQDDTPPRRRRWPVTCISGANVSGENIMRDIIELAIAREAELLDAVLEFPEIPEHPLLRG